MSLINRMLQDLDARAGQPGAAPLPSDVRPVPPPERAWPLTRVAVVAAVAAVVTAAGFAGWRLLGPKPEPVSIPAPAAAPVPVPAPAQIAAAPVVAFEVPVPPRQDAAAAVQPVVEKAAEPANAETPVPVTKAVPPAAAQAAAKPPRAAASKPAAATAKPVAPPAPEKGGRIETPAQRAENAYRRALAGLEDGRLTETIAGLRAALKIDPRHEAARQTLVGLLIEARRPDEAIRELGAALALDPRQPAMAMLMARLQLERGGPGIETLLRTLPYAAGNGEYHAFLAGALQRAQRHREAVAHYDAALRSTPQNGVWWMGMGISLEAEQRDLEAAVAYRRALDGAALSEPLREFVERKLRQLGR